MAISKNMKAFLDMLAYSEGTDNGRQKTNNHGYDVIVGIKSTAAGRYQVLAKFYDAYKKQLRLPDFSPASQDAIAMQLIRECKATADIEAGRIADAIHKCRSRWASLPGAGYGQHEQKLDKLIQVYKDAGGAVA